MDKFSWEIQPKYSNEESKTKKLPVFYDHYDLTKDFNNVYEPAEDTFLLIDAITNDLVALLGKKNIGHSIELGCGNGLISACYLAHAKDNGINLVSHTCVDINKEACALTQSLLEHYHLNANATVVESALLEAIEVGKVFDIIFFNPPYVTTDNDEYASAIKKKDISAAWAGGKNGSETIFDFILQLKTHIDKGTVIYLLLSGENECVKIISMMKDLYGFKSEMIMKRKAVNERLGVFKFYH